MTRGRFTIGASALLLLAGQVLAQGTRQSSPRLDTSKLGGVTVAELRALPPLPKVHYSYPIWTFLEPVHPAVREYARITHAITVSAKYHKEQQVRNALEVCRQINADNPAIPASLGIHYPPYHVIKPGVMDFGKLHCRELETMYRELNQIRRWVRKFNGTRSAPIAVTMVLLECEQYWFLPSHSPEQKAATIRKYDEAYDVAKCIFPDAVIEWYNRGQVLVVERPPDFKIDWRVYSRFCGEEKGDAFSCSLYCLPEIGYTRETFTRTREHAREHDLRVHAWIALGSGFQRDPSLPGGRKFALNWDYDLAYSWHAGFDVNRRWDARAGIFYPGPFDSRTPQWGKHFQAYAKGAHRIPL